MTETTYVNAEVPADFSAMIQEKVDELKHINAKIARNREEIDWLAGESQKSLHRLKNYLKEMNDVETT